VPAEVGLGGAVGRPVVVGQVEVRDAEVERPPQGRPLPLERHVVAEVVPETEADRREVEAAAARPAVGHRVVAVVGCAVGHPRIVPVRGGTRRAALSRGTQIASGSSGRSAPTDRSPTPSVRTCSGQNRSRWAAADSRGSTARCRRRTRRRPPPAHVTERQVTTRLHRAGARTLGTGGTRPALRRPRRDRPRAPRARAGASRTTTAQRSAARPAREDTPPLDPRLPTIDGNVSRRAAPRKIIPRPEWALRWSPDDPSTIGAPRVASHRLPCSSCGSW
jgi:hypothetical protein